MKSKQSILLIQQYLKNSSEIGPIFPLGLSYIATALKKEGIITTVIDLNLFNTPYLILKEVLSDTKPELIGISLRNIDNVDFFNFVYFYEELSKTLQKIREYSPKSVIIIGGSGFSIFAQKIMERHKEISFGVYLEGENTIIELLNNLNTPHLVKGLFYRSNGNVYFTGKRKFPEFDKLPTPDRSFFKMDSYKYPLCVGIQSKRGCVLQCSYCTYPYLNGKDLRLRSSTSVVDEIEMLIRDYKIDEIIFTDNIFNIPVEHAEEILNEVLKRKLKIKWSAWFDVKIINQNFIELAKKTGCYRMCFSPDGIVNETLKSLGKNFNETDINRLVNLCKINPETDFRFSLFALPPNQTTRGLFKTISFVFKTHVILRNSKCLVSWIRILPNSEIYNRICYNKEATNNYELLPEILISKHNLFFKNQFHNTVITLIYTFTLRFIILLRNFRKLLSFSSTRKFLSISLFYYPTSPK
jgi:anaerobic magnesium-protoporphyrin IX monomethyl ester cyclase